jgi:hypothetical protein
VYVVCHTLTSVQRSRQQHNLEIFKMNQSSLKVNSDAKFLTEAPDQQEPAHKRAPIEVWEAILNIVIESPLIPYLRDDIVDIDSLFSAGCASQRIHRRVEAIRTRLRLVCRAWDASLSNKGVKIITKAFQGYAAHRFEALEIFRCTCHSPCAGSLFNASRYPEQDANDLANVKIGIIFNGYPVELLLNSSSRLRALHFRQHPWSTRVNSVLQHHRIQYLTHLQLEPLTEQDMLNITGPINLARLRCLSLKFVTGDFTMSNSGPNLSRSETRSLERWSMPNLQTLRLDGRLSASSAPYIQEFISNMPDGITSLYIGLLYGGHSNSRDRPAITSSIWPTFPNLRTFGTTMEILSRAQAPPSSMYQQLSLVTDCIWDESIVGPHRGRPSIGIVSFILNLRKWRPSSIILLSSWEEINAAWKKRQRSTRAVSMWPPEFFSTALARGIRLLDINRTPVHDEKELPFLQNILG